MTLHPLTGIMVLAKGVSKGMHLRAPEQIGASADCRGAFPLEENMNTADTLNELRRLRIDADTHRAKADEYLHRATRGTSAKRAIEIGGTGNCPLTDFAGRHARAQEQYKACAAKANAIWTRVRPLLEAYDCDTQCVIELFYNQGAEMQDVARSVKRSLKACEKMQAHVCLTLRMES